jgi:hypothetical protein
MKKTYVILLVGIASIKGYSQTTTPTTTPVVTPTAPTVQAKEWDVSLYGFIRTDYIWDTRKCAQVREEQLNLYPLDVVLDANGKDINAVGQSNFLAITSRLGVKVKGPDVWGAKMSGTLEGDFFGNSETATTSTIGLFRLRHAFVNMDWSKTSLTMGQTWYPTFIPEVFPGVENFNTGILFNVFGWATQVKLKQNFTKELSATFTAFKEREFTAPGPGSQNSASINSALPSLNAQLQYKGKNVFLGAGVEYKSMQPLTVSATNLVTTEKVNSSSVFGYAKYSNDKIIVKAYGISGGNMNNLVMLGGFTGTTTAGIQSYDPTKTTSFWVDIASNGKSIAPGFFFGNSKNNGANTAATALNSIYMRGLTGSRVVDNVWRVSGRVDFKKNKFRVSPELEYTAATWGDADLYGKATTNKKDVGNLRTMVSCVYLF